MDALTEDRCRPRPEVVQEEEEGEAVRIVGGTVYCLICRLSPIERRDSDGLCVSCRASVADGLYRIHWVMPESNPESAAKTRYGFYSVEMYAAGQRLMFRVVETISVSVHPLGYEYPNVPEPILYRPELLPEIWRVIDRTVRTEQTAIDTLARLEEYGK